MTANVNIQVNAKDNASGVLSNIAKGIAQGFGQGLYNAVASGLGALPQLFSGAISAASDLNETVSKAGVIFGKYSVWVTEWGKAAATSMGMSSNEAIGAAATYGNLFKAMGMTEKKSYDMSTSIVELAGDLSSFNNIPTADVLEKLRAGLTGESEPLKSLGVNMDQAAIEAEALNLKLMKAKGTLTASAKAQAVYSLILKQTTAAQGDFARTSDGLANQQRIFAASLKNTQAALGTALLPVVNKVMNAITKLFSNKAVMQGIHDFAKGLGQIGDVLSVVFDDLLSGDLGLAFDDFKEGMLKIIPPGMQQGFINLVSGISNVINWLKNQFLPAVQTVFGWVRDNVFPILQNMYNWLNNTIPQAIGVITTAWNTQFSPAIQAAWGWVRDNSTAIWQPVFDWIGSQIPNAIETGKAAWGTYTTTMGTLVDYINGPVKTAFDNLVTQMEKELPGATLNLQNKFLILKWGFQDITTYLNDYVVPIFTTIKDIIGILIEKAITPLTNLLTGTFYLAWQGLAQLLNIDVKGAFSGLQFGTLQPLVDFFNGPMRSALVDIYSRLQNIKNFLQTFSIPNLSIPGGGMVPQVATTPTKVSTGGTKRGSIVSSGSSGLDNAQSTTVNFYGWQGSPQQVAEEIARAEALARLK